MDLTFFVLALSMITLNINGSVMLISRMGCYSGCAPCLLQLMLSVCRRPTVCRRLSVALGLRLPGFLLWYLLVQCAHAAVLCFIALPLVWSGPGLMMLEGMCSANLLPMVWFFVCFVSMHLTGTLVATFFSTSLMFWWILQLRLDCAGSSPYDVSRESTL